MTRGKKSAPRPGHVWDVWIVEADGSRRIWGKNHPTEIAARRAWATAECGAKLRENPVNVEFVERAR